MMSAIERLSSASGPPRRVALWLAAPALAGAVVPAIEWLRSEPQGPLLEEGWLAWGPWVLLVGGLVGCAAALAGGRARGPGGWWRPATCVAWALVAGIATSLAMLDWPPGSAAMLPVALDVRAGEVLWMAAMLAVCTSTFIGAGGSGDDLTPGLHAEATRQAMSEGSSPPAEDAEE